MSGSNALILRTVYALNSNTGKFLSSGQILLTDGLGGTFWTSALSSLSIDGGSIMNNLPSTISTFTAEIYQNTSYFVGLSSMSTDMYTAISSLSTSISLTVQSNINNLNGVSSNAFNSTIAGLGGIGWASTSAVYAAISSANASGQVSDSSVSTIASGLSSFGIYPLSTLNTFNTSSFIGLGSIGYVSSYTLFSSLEGLGTFGYVTNSTFTSSVIGLGTLGYVSSQSIASTVTSLGSVGYISTQSLQSSIAGLGSFGYISAATLCNYVTQGFSTLITTSTITGLGSFGYVSTSALVSTSLGIQQRNPDIRFDTTTSVTTIGSYNTFVNAGTVIYISTFLKSSISYSGTASGVQIAGRLIPPYDMTFSTASIDFTPFRPYINSNSRITLDIFPTLAFTKLATGATNVAILPISSFIQQGNNRIFTTTVTSFLYAGNTRVSLENGTYVDASNVCTTPTTLQLPPGTVSNYSQPYNLVHYMPNSINNAGFQNALHSTLVTPYFSPKGSIYVSVQNMA